jgi:hypothetical protein
MALVDRSQSVAQEPRQVQLGLLTAILFVAALAGGIVGGAIVNRIDIAGAVPDPALQAAPVTTVAGPTFDAPAFRADERAPLSQPSFDAPAFRADERAPLAR